MISRLKASAVTASLLMWSVPVLCAGDPYLVESKVQSDLDSTLSRLINKQQFLVLVSTEVTKRLERKLIEGETFSNPRQAEKPQFKPMPGFIPDADLEPPDRPQQSRQLYRVVETPVLTAVRVHIAFDDALSDAVVEQARRTARNYLNSSYPQNARLSFETIPMLKKAPEPAPLAPGAPVPDNSVEPWWSQYVPAVLLLAAVLSLGLLFVLGRRPVRPQHDGRAKEHGDATQQQNELPRAEQGLLVTSDDAIDNSNEDPEIVSLRKRVIDRFLSKPEAFRIYFNKLSEQERVELMSALKGPALDNLLVTLGLVRPAGEDFVPPDLNEFLESKEKDFVEHVQAKEWQDRQFFGFLYAMTDQQLLALVAQSSAVQVAAMLRFMKPHQSASVLETLSQDRRREVIANARGLAHVPFSDLEVIEREIRAVAMRLPAQISNPQGEVEFWGAILAEAEDQVTILDDLETTNPGISPNLKQYKFKLEDAAALPDAMLGKVLADADNEELGLALVTCPENVVDVILDAVSIRRRDFVVAQLESFRQAPRDLLVQARRKLTKRFREALA